MESKIQMINSISKIPTELFRILIIGILLSMCGIAGYAQSKASTETPDSITGGETFEIQGDSLILVTDSISVTAPPKKREPRKITPIDTDDQKPVTVLHYYDKHGNPLDEPVLFLATLDTVSKPKSSPVYPLYDGISVGVNFADLIMRMAGQRYMNFDVWADVSLHNWFFPVLEAGIGVADSSPKNANFTYRTSPSFYCKLGINYNFLYKSNPDYQLYLGLRGGFSSFSYDVRNINVADDYWHESTSFDMNGLKATALYGEALIGLKVKIYKRFFMGWNIRYHFKFHVASKSTSEPWFIPGYGASSPISFSLSAIYTLPGAKRPDPKIKTEKN